ncbi:MAG: hypothetical protein M3177_01635, partial [Pseudomonadota bacterium]|nr:hypothetical protein [Pseudomonadota bacterium]
LEGALAASGLLPIVDLQPSPLAARKSATHRREVRQAAFASALSQAVEIALPRAAVVFEPGAPDFTGVDVFPVCSLADADGEDMRLGILCDADEATVSVIAAAPPRAAPRVRLGKMWARPCGGAWLLLERLVPAWRADAA